MAEKPHLRRWVSARDDRVLTYAHAFSPKPALQLLRSRRRNVSFAEAMRKPRFDEAYFMVCQLPRYTLSFPIACGPFSGAVRRVGTLQWCHVVCDVSILCKRVCVPLGSCTLIIEQAEIALYEARNEGRNQVCAVDNGTPDNAAPR